MHVEDEKVRVSSLGESKKRGRVLFSTQGKSFGPRSINRQPKRRVATEFLLKSAIMFFIDRCIVPNLLDTQCDSQLSLGPDRHLVDSIASDSPRSKAALASLARASGKKRTSERVLKFIIRLE